MIAGWSLRPGERPLQPPSAGLAPLASVSTGAVPLSVPELGVHRGIQTAHWTGAPLEPPRTLARCLPGCEGSRCVARFVILSGGLTLSLQVHCRGQAPPGHRAKARARACRRSHLRAVRTAWESPNIESPLPTCSPRTCPDFSLLPPASPLSFQITRDTPSLPALGCAEVRRHLLNCCP